MGPPPPPMDYRTQKEIWGRDLPPPNTRHMTYPPPSLGSNIWWSSLETCSLVHLRSYPHQYWQLVVASESGRYASYWNAVLCFICLKQDCIPVRCIPPARWPYLPVCSPLRGGGGGCLPDLGGVCLVLGEGGACLVRGGACLVQGGCLVWGRCLVWGGAWFGGCLVRGVWYPSMHWGRHPPPWTESQTPVKILPCPNFVLGGN